MNKIDLHMHSMYSIDGEKSVKELLQIASDSNIEYIAIADHNCTKAYHENIDQSKVKVINAIELDCTFQDLDFHLLGYGINPQNPIFDHICDSVLKAEYDSGKKRLDYVRNEMNIKIDQAKLDELCPDGIYVAEQICEVALLDEANKDNPYLKEFYPGGKLSDNPLVNFFWEYCAKGKIAYFPMEFMSMEDAIKLYRSFNAFVCLAHPGNNVKENDQLLKDIIDLGIDGIEVYSSYHNDKQIEYYKKYANDYNLVVTCGSDYHGKTKPTVVMGECRMPKDEEAKLIDYIKNRFNI